MKFRFATWKPNSNKLLKWFLRYRAEMKIHDGSLAAILDFNHPRNYALNGPSHIEQKPQSKTVAWWPYWISGHPEICT